VLEDRANTNLRPIKEVVQSALDQIQRAFDAEGDVTGVGTGFRDWDRLSHGLQGGDLVILAARPAMGKTSFALNVAVNAAARHGASVAVFSLEMPAEQLAQRLLSCEARIDLSSLRGGYLQEDEWPRLVQASDDLAKTKLFLDDLPGATPTQIRAKCRRLKRREGLDLVIIDYLQLMNAGTRMGSREQEISYISRSLKGLAKDLSCPVIALSQLNRGLESRTDKRPMMSDLRESGAIEQDADMICFIYREEVYNKECPPEQQGVAELIVGKHRNGPTGTVKLKFWKAWTRFDNLAQEPRY
jgi:replicative DNA helicase